MNYSLIKLTSPLMILIILLSSICLINPASGNIVQKQVNLLNPLRECGQGYENLYLRFHINTTSGEPYGANGGFLADCNMFVINTGRSINEYEKDIYFYSRDIGYFNLSQYANSTISSANISIIAQSDEKSHRLQVYKAEWGEEPESDYFAYFNSMDHLLWEETLTLNNTPNIISIPINPIEIQGKNTLKILIKFADDSNPASDSQFVQFGSARLNFLEIPQTGTLSFDQAEYMDIHHNPWVEVTDSDLNKDPNVAETVTIQLTSYYNEEPIFFDNQRIVPTGEYTREITLHEIGTDSPFFRSDNLEFMPYQLFADQPNTFPVSTRFPGQIKAAYNDETNAEGVPVTAEKIADTKFNLVLNVKTEGSFVNNPEDINYEAHLPLIINLTQESGITPGIESDIWLTTKAGQNIFLGRTDFDGNLQMNVPLNEINEPLIVNKEVYIWGNHDEGSGYVFYGDVGPTQLCSKELIFGPKSLTWDISLVTQYQLWKFWASMIKGVFDPKTYLMNIFFLLNDLSKASEIFLQHFGSILDFTVYWNEEVNYQPDVGDVMYYIAYTYSAEGVSPAAAQVLKVQKNTGEIVTRSAWADKELVEKHKFKYIYGMGIRVIFNSPVLPYVTAPDGSHAGYDPITGNLTMDFPIYISNPGDEPFYLYIPYAGRGNYTIDLIGTGNGPFSITLESTDEQGNIISQSFYSGTIELGEIQKTFVNISVLGPTISSITPAKHRHGGKAFRVIINGTDFHNGVIGTNVILWKTTETKNITATNVIVESSTGLTCFFKLPKKAKTGVYHVTVINPDEQKGKLMKGFKVKT